MKNGKKDLLKVIGASALVMTLASAAFLGLNSLTSSATTRPEQLASNTQLSAAVADADTGVINLKAAATQQEYKTPKLTVILDKDSSIPSGNAMSYEEAAEIGAQYIWDMYGDSIDGKTVKMFYCSWSSHTNTYWMGTVADSEKDFENYKSSYIFQINAVTGERVSIGPLTTSRTSDLGEGKTYTMSPVEMEALQHVAPENVDEYAQIAREAAQKHFNHTKVAAVEFVSISLINSKEEAESYRMAWEAGKDKPFTFTLYEKGRQIEFNVTDDTGRVASITIDTGTKVVEYLDTKNNDIVPGFNADIEGSVG